MNTKTSTAKLRPSLEYRADIDGLRAIAVLPVVAFHAFPESMTGGFIGVDVFFVISGFLISSLILNGLDHGTFSFRDFFARRILRILPGLLVVLIASLLVGWWVLFPDEYAHLGKHVAAGTGFVSNLVLWSEAGYFDASALTKPLLHLWSLGIEEQYYLVWPLVLWLAWHHIPRLLLSLTVVFALVSYHLSTVQGNQAAAFFNPANRFWELWVGSALALLLRHDTSSWTTFLLFRQSPRMRRTFANILSVCGCVILAWGFWHIDEHMLFPGPWALVPVLSTVLVIAAGPHAWVNRVVLSRSLLVWFGLISFALYLWHWPILTLARIVSFDPLSSIARMGLVVLSVLLAWVTYVFVERPVRRTSRARLHILLLAGMLGLTFAFGYLTYAHAGWTHRGISQHKALVAPEAKMRENRLLDTFQTFTAHQRGESSKPVILIIGDSYLPAWSVALSAYIDQDRYDILSLSYLDCTVVHNKKDLQIHAKVATRTDACKSLNHYMHNQAITRRIAAVLMVGHRPFEYAANTFRFDLVRWLHANDAKFDLYVFGNYFQLDPTVHPSCEKLMQRTRQDASICLERAVYPRSDMLNRDLRYFPAELDFHFVDPIRLHCSHDKVKCLTEIDGVPFISDWNHLNAVFLRGLLADILGKQRAELLDSGLLKYFAHRGN